VGLRDCLAPALAREGKKNFPGKDWGGARLDGWDFSMSLLIGSDFSGCRFDGANLLGADLRDANLCGADLSEALFLTQGQINAAKGDASTRLPRSLTRPGGWPLQ
jgi:uncharacterized protein YjbI with pentapeptide repeats